MPQATGCCRTVRSYHEVVVGSVKSAIGCSRIVRSYHEVVVGSVKSATGYRVLQNSDAISRGCCRVSKECHGLRQ